MQGTPRDQREQEWRRRSRTTAWAGTSVVLGVMLMIGSLLPPIANGQRAPFVLGDAELVPVFGLILFVLGLLVIMQEWSGLS